jgi:hypothetical protein
MNLSTASRSLLGLSLLALALASPVGCGGSAPDPGGGTSAAASDRGTCPTVKPSTGTACTQEGLYCLFGKHPTGCDSDDGSCINGKWSVSSTPGCPQLQDSGVSD